MKTIQTLITDHLDIWTAAETAKKSGRGRSSGNAASVYGIKKLRELILELAVRGKLVPQDTNDEPASELLKRILAEKTKLIFDGKIKKGKTLSPLSNEEKPFDLPHGWKWARLGNVIDYVNGFAFSSKDFTTQGIGVVKIGDIQQGKIEPEFMSRVSEDAVDSLDARLQVIKGDLVIAMSGATTGKLGFNDTEEVFYLNQRVGKIVPFVVSKRFLYFDLTTKIAENLKKSFGSAIPNLSTEQINTIVTALPPIEEQHRIVAKVDELMALCDQLESQHSNAAEAHEKLVSHLLGTLTQSQNAEDFSANWQRIAVHFGTLFTTEASIDALKQTLLQLAVMGKLVPQDANDEPASELLKRIQAEKAKLIVEGKIKKPKPLVPISDEEKLFILPKEWDWVRLEDLMPEFQNGASSRGDSDGDPVIVLRLADIKDRRISLDEPRELLILPSMIEKYRLSLGDILIVRVNGSSDLVGGFVVCDQSFDGIYCDHFIRMRIPQNSLNPRFLSLVGASQLVRNRIQDLFITTAGQKTVNQSHIGSLIIPLLSVAEQRRIVAKVDELMATCDQLKFRITEANQLQQKLADVVVKQAIN